MSLVLNPGTADTRPSKARKVKNQRPVFPVVSLIAGGITGGLEAGIAYPFEFAKTRLQLRGQSELRNPFAVISRVVRNEGFRSLYTGCSSLVIGTALKTSVRFLAFDSIKNVLADSSGNLSAGKGVLAGMAAGAVESVTAVTPTERIKTALIDDAKGQKRFRSGLHAAKTLVQEGGFRELYRGLLSTTLKQSGTSAIRMGSCNVLKETAKSNGISQNGAATFGMGAIAGTITVYATQPLDTIKTRTQSAAGSGTMEAFVSVLRDSGIHGFWKGSTVRLGRLVFSGGIVFSAYEQVVHLLR